MIEIIKNKNTEILSAQKEWYNNIMVPYINNQFTKREVSLYASENEKYNDVKISCPFCMGLTDEYINSHNKKIMIVGQVARKLGSWSKQWQGRTTDDLFKDIDTKEDYWPAKRMQNWANDYLECQLKNSTSEKYNSSAFWDFFRDLKSCGNISLCWNDLDKVNFVENDGKEKNLTYKDETVLSSKYEYDGESLSLLQREIKIAKPDIIIFAIGPYYSLSLDVALGVSDYKYNHMSNIELSKKSLKVSKLFKDYPSKNRCVVQNNDLKVSVNNLLGRETVVLWTYHPTALRRLKLYSQAIKDIAKIINK